MCDIEANIIRGDLLEMRELALWSHLLSVVRQAKIDAREFQLEAEAAYKYIDGQAPEDESVARYVVGELLEGLRTKSVQIHTPDGVTSCSGYVSGITFSAQKSRSITFSMDEAIRKLIVSNK